MIRTAARKVRIRYQSEPEGWWAESPDMPRWTAASDALEGIRQLVREGVEFVLGLDPSSVEILEELPSERKPS